MKIVNNIRVGKPQVSLDISAHTPGVNEGNKPGGLKKEAGLKPMGKIAIGTARRSTGINPKGKNPLLPEMPNISPP